MSITITRHAKNQTITRATADAAGAPRSATHVVYWLSDDAQSDLVVGWGESADEAVMDAQREIRTQGITGGSIAVYDVGRPAHRPRRDPSAARVQLTTRVHPDTLHTLAALSRTSGRSRGQIVDALVHAAGEIQPPKVL